ncbi:cytochrome b/b6 domain-containing protein [Xylophilus sp.]|uniref:cytochrome b/b6 domain-containing protein n=1 Tax=Xylophilus sp. TaxID=2653893 RepID=UPI0013B78C61|nr:cytochrome b/b6 domain-containing protein [Xylophilus sp.]KAF1044850.1 MAG: hypothetical protein GAK38_03322 [Xylophilus sp.]
MPHTKRIWDLPTRLFHWTLAASVIALVATAKVGGAAMDWHFRLGYLVLALLLFRLVWGFVGGHWSRFVNFLPLPHRTLAYLRGRAEVHEVAGHTPLGAWSVLALLLVLAVQVVSGLSTDDAISFTGPLAPHVPSGFVDWASGWHKGTGQWLVIGLVVLHVAAVLVYLLTKGRNLTRTMLTGDGPADASVPASRDSAGTRLLALVLALAAGAAAYGVYRLG